MGLFWDHPQCTIRLTFNPSLSVSVEEKQFTVRIACQLLSFLFGLLWWYDQDLGVALFHFETIREAFRTTLTGQRRDFVGNQSPEPQLGSIAWIISSSVDDSISGRVADVWFYFRSLPERCCNLIDLQSYVSPIMCFAVFVSSAFFLATILFSEEESGNHLRTCSSRRESFVVDDEGPHGLYHRWFIRGKLEDWKQHFRIVTQIRLSFPGEKASPQVYL